MPSVRLFFLWLILFLESTSSPISSSAPLAIHLSIPTLPLPTRLISRIYDSSHIFLISVPPPYDLPSPPHNNFLIHRSHPFHPHAASHTLDLLDAMSYFLSHPSSFSHFISITSSHYPLLPLSAISQILSTAPNTSFIPIGNDDRDYSRELYTVHTDPGLAFNFTLEMPQDLPSIGVRHPDIRKRTSAWWRAKQRSMVLSRPLVKHAVESMQAKRLLLTLSDAANVTDWFFATLAYGSKHGGRVVSSKVICKDGEQKNDNSVCMFVEGENIDKQRIDVELHRGGAVHGMGNGGARAKIIQAEMEKIVRQG